MNRRVRNLTTKAEMKETCCVAALFLLTDSPDFPTPLPPITATFTIFFCFREKLRKKLKGVLLELVDFDAIRVLLLSVERGETERCFSSTKQVGCGRLCLQVGGRSFLSPMMNV